MPLPIRTCEQGRQRAQGLRHLSVLLAFCVTLATAASAAIGDRLVVSINGVPYTQRQVEIYIHVKESLRKTNDGNVRLIAAANWGDAITVFTEDMIFLQEAQRLGSFQTPDQALSKYLEVVHDKMAKGEALRATFARLGADETMINRSLEEVLRVAAFRRSKDHQDAQGKKSAPSAPGKAELVKGLVDLIGRAVVRRYEEAEKFEVIEPVRQGGGP